MLGREGGGPRPQHPLIPAPLPSIPCSVPARHPSTLPPHPHPHPLPPLPPPTPLQVTLWHVLLVVLPVYLVL